VKEFKCVFVVLLVILAQVYCTGQDYRALRTGPYSGINAQSVHPAYHRHNTIKWDINLIGAGIDVSTNYGHFNNKSGIRFIRTLPEIIESAESIENSEDIASELDISYSSTKNTRAHLDLELNGPGFYINLSRYSIGLFSKISFLGLMNDLPNYNQSVEIGNTGFNERFEFPKAEVAMISLAQIGLSISSSVGVSSYSHLHYGVNIKNYKSTDLVYAQSNRQTEAVKSADSLLLIDAEFEGAFFSNFNHELETQESNYNPSINGNGWGMDIGVIYEKRQNSYSNNSLKLAASISDIGYVNYTDGFYHHFTLDNGFIVEQNITDESITDELSKLLDIEDKVYIDQSQEKSILAPATINLMAEYVYDDRLLFNISIRENIPNISPIERSSYISATAQYNHKWWGFTAPLSLYNHSALRVGSALRLGPLTLGTDNLLPLILPVNLRAANFYFSLNINSSMLDFLEGRSSRNRSKGKSPSIKNVKCYYFDN